MLPINKRDEPPGIRQYKKNNPATANYEGFKRCKAEFFELRENLLREQCYVCAYCGQAIPIVENENGLAQMKTEHFEPQNGNADNDLNYKNLLACCLGGQDKAGENYCDSRKGETRLVFLQNPAFITSRDNTIRYKVKPNDKEVLILSSIQEKNDELISVLGLNHDFLRSRRFYAWKNCIWKVLGEQRTWSRARVQQVRDSYATVSNGCHKEFKDFLVWYLDDWLAKNTRK